MKKLLLFISLCFIGCTKMIDSPIVEVSSKYPMVDTTITVVANTAKIVKINSDTLAVLTKTASVAIPKFAPISITEIDNTNNIITNKYALWETIAFEDSKVGDMDYNDLVIHTKIEQKNNNTLISVHPIALGSVKVIKLGIRISGKDYYIASNCREELFNNETGFINTLISKPRVKYTKFTIKNFPTTVCTYGKSLNWFIEVDNGLRLYAVSKNYPSSRAYGIILVNINDYVKYNGVDCGADWFDYPQETVSIDEVYPDFKSEIKTFKEIYSNKHNGYYPAVIIKDNIIDEKTLYLI